MLAEYHPDDVLEKLLQSKKESNQKRWLQRVPSRGDDRRRTLVAAGQQLFEREDKTFEVSKQPNGFSAKWTYTRVRQYVPTPRARPETFCLPLDNEDEDYYESS